MKRYHVIYYVQKQLGLNKKHTTLNFFYQLNFRF